MNGTGSALLGAGEAKLVGSISILLKITASGHGWGSSVEDGSGFLYRQYLLKCYQCNYENPDCESHTFSTEVLPVVFWEDYYSR